LDSFPAEGQLFTLLTFAAKRGSEYLAQLLVRALPGMTRRAADRRGPLQFTISSRGVFSKLI
jgi:hypothetical protein